MVLILYCLYISTSRTESFGLNWYGLRYIDEFFFGDRDLAFRSFRMSLELIGAPDASFGMQSVFGIYGGSDESKYGSTSLG